MENVPNREPIVERMQPYDGDGYLCYVADGNGGNVGFGPTPEAARQSWAKGEDIGEAAMRKWAPQLAELNGER